MKAILYRGRFLLDIKTRIKDPSINKSINEIDVSLILKLVVLI